MRHEDIKQIFSKRLIHALKDRRHLSNKSSSGVKISPLAKAIGCSTQMVSKYVNGKALPDHNTAIKIAKFLDVSPGWLVYGDNTNPSRAVDEFICIDKELLTYILGKVSGCSDKVCESNSADFINFCIEIISDISHLKLGTKDIYPIIDMSFKSFRLTPYLSPTKVTKGATG